MLALYTICTAILVSGIASAIFTDEVLRRHYLSISCICACSFFALCIITLSRHCKLRRKTSAFLEPLETLCDSDLEPDDEQVTSDTASYLAWLKNFAIFCKIRPIYGIVVFTSVVFSIVSLLLSHAFDTEEDLRIGSDPWSAKALLLISAIVVIAIVIVVASFEKFERKPEDFSYHPFNENVNIPMSVYVPKILAVLMADEFNFCGGFLIQLIAVIALLIVCNLSDQNITDVLQGSKMKQTILICMMAGINFVVLLYLIEKISKAYETTRDYLLGIFEKNWQRNLKACEYLLPGIPQGNNLEDLRLALLDKINDPDLTNEEKKIIEYMKTPFWKTKRAFVYTLEVYQAENSVPRRRSTGAAEDQNPPGPPDGAPGSNRSSPSPDISPPVTRSKAKRRR